MFTGLIEEVGGVVALETKHHGTRLQIAAPRLAAKIQIGDSIAVNGCCLTVTARRDDRLAFDLLEETIERTNLKTLRRDDRVNRSELDEVWSWHAAREEHPNAVARH